MKKVFVIFCVTIFTGFIFVSTIGSSFSPLEIKTKPVPLPKVGEGATRRIMVEATAYGPPLFPEKSLTSTGEPVGWGVVAVDPRVIPLGSVLCFPEIFPGQKFYAGDTGKKIKGAGVDIWLPRKKAVQKFGRRHLLVEVLKDKSP